MKQRLHSAFPLSLILLCTAPLMTSVAFAEKPAWKEGTKHQKQQERYNPHAGKEKEHRRQIQSPSRHRGDSSAQTQGAFFGARHRTAIHDYYANQIRSGHCPPGLAKKNNGCLPPGQAKKWAIGQPLPRDVVFYDLPPAAALAIGPAPTGYRYVRVASDILMIAIGTGMVMDAIRDLGGR